MNSNSYFEEDSQVYAQSPQLTEAEFKEIDKDGDGKITRSEWEDYIRRFEDKLPLLGQPLADKLFGPTSLESQGLFSGGPRMFPAMFTLFCFVAFLVPIYITNRIGNDIHVQYWITSHCWVVLWLPILYLITHTVHAARRAPSKPLVLICLLGSCGLLLGLSDMVLWRAYAMANRFASRDCQTFEGKQYLEVQRQNAKSFYADCMASTAAQAGMSFDATVKLYRIQDCERYPELLKSNPGWPYLAQLEDENNCAGWCTHEQPLWTFKPTKDRCTMVVADIMSNKVQRFLTHVVVYTTIVLVFIAMFLALVGPVFKGFGMEW